MKNEIIDQMNEYGKNHTPFLFIIDFDITKPIVIPLDQMDNKRILFNIRGFKNYPQPEWMAKDISFIKFPMPFQDYQEGYDCVMKNLRQGNSYLTNLTYPTKVETNLKLKEIFFISNAMYKLWLKDQFVVFSPEKFIIIQENSIFSYPMKGTIDASVPNAKRKILEDEKEFAEHITIVDLIRNDLSMVSYPVQVNKFRYTDTIHTNHKILLQVSSEITGTLPDNWHENLGQIICSLLPAGSITGAPKKKTVEIIKEAEQYNRGYYTGIFGFYDGYCLDSAVIIRYIENINNQLFYKSGGGITIYSDIQSEYQELIDKVYIPVG